MDEEPDFVIIGLSDKELYVIDLLQRTLVLMDVLFHMDEEEVDIIVGLDRLETPNLPPHMKALQPELKKLFDGPIREAVHQIGEMAKEAHRHDPEMN